MALSSTFMRSYGDNPWQNLTDKTRDVWIPQLISTYKRQSYWSQLIGFYIDLSAYMAEEIHFTQLYELPETIAAVPDRQLWFDTLATDSESKSITTARRVGKVSHNRYDELITQWEMGGAAGARGLIQGQLGTQLVATLDKLARLAFLKGSRHHVLTGTGAGAGDWTPRQRPDFSGMGQASSMGHFNAFNYLDTIKLRVQNFDRHGSIDMNGIINPSRGEYLAFTTPGVIRSIEYAINNAAYSQSLPMRAGGPGYLENVRYAAPGRFLSGTLPVWKGITFVPKPDMYLFNCGAVRTQVAITAPLHIGGGARRNVDANRVVGQADLASGVSRFVQCSNFDEGDFQVNDRISIHATRTAAHGIVHNAAQSNGVGYSNSVITLSDGQGIGVDPYEETLWQARIVGVNHQENRLELDRPVLWPYIQDLGGGCYGYVTKGQHVSQTLVLTGSQPILGGTSLPPHFVFANPVDDTNMHLRTTWQGWIGYDVWNDNNMDNFWTLDAYADWGAPTANW